jgi:anti-sigma regulatory factor (Ser/Thr protein kinase)
MLPADLQRSQATATLPPGATLMLYTDGLVERRNQPLDKGIDAAAVTVAEHAEDHPDDVADHVMSAMTPAAGYEDDVAVLIYRHLPAPLTVELPADDPSCLALLRARLRQWLSAAGVGSGETTDIMIATGEAAGNAVEHATAGRPADAAPVQITLTARVAQNMVQLTVADTGSWRSPPPTASRPPRAPEATGSFSCTPSCLRFNLSYAYGLLVGVFAFSGMLRAFAVPAVASGLSAWVRPPHSRKV